MIVVLHDFVSYFCSCNAVTAAACFCAATVFAEFISSFAAVPL